MDARLREGRGGHTAIYTDAERWSYRAVDARAASLAARFAAEGVTPGSRVLVALPDGADLVAACFGALRLGAIAAVANPYLPEGHLARLTAYVTPAAVLTTETRQAECAAVSASARVLTPGEIGPATGAVPPVHRGSPGEDAIWQFTSGSRGEPKAVRHSHWGLLAAAEAYGTGVLRLSPDDVTLAAPRLPFGYAMGLNFLFPFAVGASIVLFDQRPTAQALVERIRRHRVTVLATTPASVRQMLDEGVSREALGSLRVAVSAGEALPSRLHTSWVEQVGCPILDGLGMTEMGHIVVSNRLDDARPGLLGRPVGGYELRVCDAAGADVPDGETGELWVRGPSMALGYWQQPEAEARVFREGWCVPGDMVRRLPDGVFEFCGRGDDMLKVNGQWVSPRAVEDCLLTHPAVREAALVGVPDEDGLVRPHALVVATEISGQLTGELQALVRGRLAAHAHPRSVTYLDALPRTAQGKIDRAALAALV